MQARMSAQSLTLLSRPLQLLILGLRVPAHQVGHQASAAS